MSILSSTHRRVATAAAVLAAGAVAAAPAIADRGIDPAIYDTGIPAGQVEHGVVDFSITGSPSPEHTRTEYWASDDRWRSITRDAKSGRVLREAFATPKEFVHLSHSGNGPRVIKGKGPEVPPMAGWTAAYNSKLVARGILRETGSRPVAGIDGVVYTVPGEKKSTDPRSGDATWVTDDTRTRTEIVLERGTHKPLVRTSTLADNGDWGTFRQSEELVSREVLAETPQTFAPLSAKAKRQTVARWNAKLRAARAKAERKRAGR